MAEDFGAANDAVFRFGNPLEVKLTPTAALEAGAVYCPDDGTSPTCYVAHSKIEANKLGNVAAAGGVYEMVSDGSLDAGGLAAYWDASVNQVTSNDLLNTHFGYTVPGQGLTAPGDKILIQHHPSRIDVRQI